MERAHYGSNAAARQLFSGKHKLTGKPIHVSVETVNQMTRKRLCAAFPNNRRIARH